MPSNINHWVPTEGLGQKTFQQCWYASYRMIYWSLGKNIDSVKTKLETVIDFPEAMKEGLLDNDYMKCATALGFDAWLGKHFNQKRGWSDVGMSDGAEALYAVLKKGPVWVSRKNDSGSFHITVLRGYDDSDGYFVYNNPYPGPKDAVVQRMRSDFYARGITYAAGSVQRSRK
ncbi:MAG: hypothetical protein DWQ47_12815 [Acidobacteria bacterium]|nr:MAG: hypothetical protein DWQ32_00215 [Acidobacteriota bacterium]REK03037.1 MAG: hypothetical protein DWQ38_11920 [Acidobacteriota bacterium]REK13159.1 MAG: hypothetical protein DWQ43_05905 [Acidobacteriota bacterium]REK41153.1 MAG: hypothetical protein DWQ47_12815 [Acidobacteriota bacterium]